MQMLCRLKRVYTITGTWRSGTCREGGDDDDGYDYKER